MSFQSTAEIKDFVKHFNLMDNRSNINFNANVEITTAKNNHTAEFSIRINFEGYDNYGTLNLSNFNLDPMLFPEIFQAKYDKFSFVDKKYLMIEGKHNKNAQIGEYKVTITPL